MADLIYVDIEYREITGRPVAAGVPAIADVTGALVDVAANFIATGQARETTDAHGHAALQLIHHPGSVYRISIAGVTGHLHCDDWSPGARVPFTALIDLPGGGTPSDLITLQAIVASAVEEYLTEHPPTGGGGAMSVHYSVTPTSGAVTLNPSNGDRQSVTLTGPATFTFAGDGQFALAINRSTSGHAATFEGVTWETPPNIAAGTNVLSFVKFGAQWFGFSSGIGFDTEPPTTPTNLAQGTTTSSSVMVTWTASTDNVAIDGYEVSLNGGAWIDVFKVTSYTLAGLATGTHQVRVRARDIKFNYSPPATITVATSAGGDTTAPVAGTLAASAIAQTSFTLTVTGASDAVALHATPYAFSTDNGATWSAWQSSAVFNATGMSAGTAYQGRHKVQDAAGNVTVGTAITVTTTAVSIDPASIAGLDLWLKNESIASLTDGDAITSWPDSSGLGNHAVQATTALQPQKTSANGKAAALFDVSGDWLTSPVSVSGGEQTVFAVQYAPDTAGVKTILSGSASPALTLEGGRYHKSRIWGQASADAGLAIQPHSTWQAIAGWYSDSGDQISVRNGTGAPVTTTTVKTVGASLTAVIGNKGTASAAEPMVGQIAEVLHYNAKLTETQIGNVVSYLKSKFGIA